MNFIVLCSSRGTTFQAVLDSIQDGSLTAQCLGLITDAKDRGCIEKAERAGIPWKVVEKSGDEPRVEFDRRVNAACQELGANNETVLAAMGWMWIMSPWFIRQWEHRILNVHPSLLPKHGGKGMYGHHVHDAVLASGETETGITILLMDEGVDSGKIIEQKICSVFPSDTGEILQKRVQELEKEWYPKVLQRIEEEGLRLAKR